MRTTSDYSFDGWGRGPGSRSPRWAVSCPKYRLEKLFVWNAGKKKILHLMQHPPHFLEKKVGPAHIPFLSFAMEWNDFEFFRKIHLFRKK